LNSSCYVTSIFDAPYESDTVNCNDNLECNYINNWKVNNYTDSVDKNDQKSKILFFKDEDLVLYVDTSSKDNKYTHDNYVFLVQNIKEYMIDNNISNNDIEITNGILKVYEKREYSPLTYSYIEQCLAKIISEKSHVDYIIQYLKNNREIKTTNELKSIYKK
jgi:hypothetical protein